MNSVLFFLVFAALALTQMLAGGRQVALFLPGCGLLALAAVLSWWPRRRIAIPRQALEPLGVAVVVFGYITVRALLSPEPFLARRDLYTASAAMALYLLVSLNLTSARDRWLIAGGLVVLALADCAIGAVQFFKDQQFMPFSFLPRPDYGTRMSGFFGYPNHLAGFLEIALMMGLSATFWSRWPHWAKILTGYFCAMIVLGIVGTGSRGGYISATVGCIVFFLLSLMLVGKLSRGRVLVCLLASLLLIAGAAFGLRKIVSKDAMLESRSDSTLTIDHTRMRMWQAAGKQFRLNPAMGTGSGTYLYYGRQFRHPSMQSDAVHVHNDFLEMLAEYGLLGMIAAVIFFETHLRRGWNALSDHIRKDTKFQDVTSNSLALTVGAMSAAVACLTHSLMDYNLHMPANLFTAAFVFALLGIPAQARATTNPEDEAGAPAFLRLALPLLGIAMFLRITPSAPGEYFAERARAILTDGRRLGSPELNHQLEDFARRGLRFSPGNAVLHYALAEALEELAALSDDAAFAKALREKSLDSYRSALENAPADVRYVRALIYALDTLEHYADAEPLCQRALALDPAGSLTHIMVGRHFFSAGKLTEAQKHFETVVRLGAGYAVEASLKETKRRLQAQAPAIEGGAANPPEK